MLSAIASSKHKASASPWQFSAWKICQVSCFSSRVILAVRKLQLEKSGARTAASTPHSLAEPWLPATVLLGVSGASLLRCKGGRCCQPPPPSYTEKKEKPGSLHSLRICRPCPGSAGRASRPHAGQILWRVCKGRAVSCDKAKAVGQRAAKGPGKEG